MSDFVRYSKLDSDRFGKRIYRADISDVAQIAHLDEFAKGEGAEMIVVRCPTRELRTTHRLEESGYLLMDTLVFYGGQTRAFEHATWTHAIRRASADDRESLHAIASDAFAEYDGHYHSDPKLDRRQATLGYVEWCLSCLNAENHSMWVATDHGALMGFIAVHHDSNAAEIRLNGVASEFQRQGVYDSLLKASGQALFHQGASRLSVSTHINNLGPQKVWTRNGMSLQSAVYTFHKWYDP